MNCLFCKIINNEIPADIIFKNSEFIGFRDINPQAPTHILVIPTIHIDSINMAQEEHETMLGRMLILAKQIAQQEGLDKNGYRLVINTNDDGGQTVHHLHVHILGGRQMHWPPG
jgi:histidine triad (HIT) family protein